MGNIGTDELTLLGRPDAVKPSLADHEGREVAIPRRPTPHNKPTAGDAAVVSTGHGAATVSSFDNLRRWLRGAPEWESDMRPMEIRQ